MGRGGNGCAWYSNLASMIIFAIFLIVILTCTAFMARKILKWPICPICAGVSGTWILILLGRNLGWLKDDWNTLLALLMGGSVVGIAYQLEKKVIAARTDAGMLWKAIFIPAGFLAVYGLIMSWWLILALSGAFLGLFFWVFSKGTVGQAHNEVQRGDKVEELKKQMEKCC